MPGIKPGMNKRTAEEWRSTNGQEGKTEKMTETATPSYIAKRRRGSSKPDFLIDSERADVSQPRDKIWDESSDNTNIMYRVKDLNLTRGRNRKPKKMLVNRKNREGVRCVSEETIPAIL